MLPHLVGLERELFRSGRAAFNRTTSVQGDVYLSGTEAGLGPAFNGDSCAMCHAYPASGGSSPLSNPQLQSASRAGGRNILPAFLGPAGPIRQVRFKVDNHGAPDGSVHPIFTIAGRIDAVGCELPQENFDRELARSNLSFRIPTPLFGSGLIEAIPDAGIVENAKANQDSKLRLGIAGHPNRSAVDGAIGRFGWKAQTASLEIFTAEAYAIEQGVTNELFPQERQASQSCNFNATPEDHFEVFAQRPIDAQSNVLRVTYFLKFLAPAVPSSMTTQSERGRKVFLHVGCGDCHTPTLVTGKSSHPALSEQPVNLYSDLLVHHMGGDLADGIRQGTATEDEFRTAPLWGVGKRLFFLHDGRTKDLSEAIVLHAKSGNLSQRSEARRVIEQFLSLTSEDRSALIAFLKTL